MRKKIVKRFDVEKKRNYKDLILVMRLLTLKVLIGHKLLVQGKHYMQ